jgi:hypothetical protein
MSYSTLSFLLVLTILKVALSCDVYDSNTSTCAEDLEEICGVTSFPDSIQSLYDSRACLKKNKDFISKECLVYLELDKPSIIDSCFVEIKSYCLHVVPGSFRLHNCLSAVPEDDLSPNCREALVYDQKAIEEKVAFLENTESVSSYWNLWSNYVSTLTDFIYSWQKPISASFFVSESAPTSYLRGTFTLFDLPASGTLEDDDANSTEVRSFFTDDDQPIDDENDDDYEYDDDADDDNEAPQMIACGEAAEDLQSEQIPQTSLSQDTLPVLRWSHPGLTLAGKN